MEYDKEGGARSIFSSFFLLAIIIFLVIFGREVTKWLNGSFELIENTQRTAEEIDKSGNRSY